MSDKVFTYMGETIAEMSYWRLMEAERYVWKVLTDWETGRLVHSIPDLRGVSWHEKRRQIRAEIARRSVAPPMERMPA